MKCEEVDTIFIDYLDNNLDTEVREKLEKHLESCERCLDLLKGSQKILNEISAEEMLLPDASVRMNFYHMLQNEIRKNEAKPEQPVRKASSFVINPIAFRIAAGIALLICGTLIGILVQSGLMSKNNAKLSQLESELASLKKNVFFTMMNTESSSNRIQALNYTDNMENADSPIIDVLIRTLNNDKNINVRMAAAYALSKYTDQSLVVDSLVQSLSRQVDPILQVTLINILVEKKEKRAVEPMQKIIKNESTLNEVRVVAENGVRMLL